MGFELTTADRRLLILLAALVLVFILWNIPQLDFVLYPFRLFVTYVHEAGHGTAALLTGGRFLGFEIFANGAGQAITAGGSRLLILPAGYLGAALFGAILFYLNNRFHYSRALSVALGVGLVIFSLLFGRISMLSLVVGLVFGGLLIVLGRRVNEYINNLVLNLLAVLTGLNAVLDVWYLVGNSGASLGAVRNDAAAFSEQVFPLPGAVWALLWAGIAVVMLGAAVWLSVIRPRRRHRDD